MLAQAAEHLAQAQVCLEHASISATYSREVAMIRQAQAAVKIAETLTDFSTKNPASWVP